MRDIRGDLQDRASLLEEQINAHEAQFDKLIEQLKREHDARLEDLKAELEAVNRLLELELRRLATAPAAPMRRRYRLREPVHHSCASAGATLRQPAAALLSHQPVQHSAHQPVHVARIGRSPRRKRNPSSRLPTSSCAS